jgi:transposase
MNENENRLAVSRLRRTYAGAFKAQVVLEALESKRGLEEIAQHYDLHPNQIKNWKCILRKRMSEVFEDRRQKLKPI